MNNQLPKTQTSIRGFTLIELLVAISILAILAVAGLIIFTGAQKNARDGRRRQDIDAIAQALETNKVTGTSTYPALTTAMFPAGSIPVDSTTAQYSVVFTTTTGTPPANPTAWPATSINPTVPAAWIPSASNTSGTISTTMPLATAMTWTICALLENGTNPNVYCKSSAQ